MKSTQKSIKPVAYNLKRKFHRVFWRDRCFVNYRGKNVNLLRSPYNFHGFAISGKAIGLPYAPPMLFASEDIRASKLQTVMIFGPDSLGNSIKFFGKPMWLSLKDSYARADDLSIARVLDRS
jgi:hypothetical protein